MSTASQFESPALAPSPRQGAALDLAAWLADARFVVRPPTRDPDGRYWVVRWTVETTAGAVLVYGPEWMAVVQDGVDGARVYDSLRAVVTYLRLRYQQGKEADALAIPMRQPRRVPPKGGSSTAATKKVPDLPPIDKDFLCADRLAPPSGAD